MDARVGLWRRLSTKELMILNCGVGEDSGESLGLQGDPTSILKDISTEYSLKGLMLMLKLQYSGHLMRRMTHWKRPWCWASLKAREGDDRGWDGWMTWLTTWTWVWTISRSWWWTGKPSVLHSMGLQRVGHDWATELKYHLNTQDRLQRQELCGLFSLP